MRQQGSPQRLCVHLHTRVGIATDAQAFGQRPEAQDLITTVGKVLFNDYA